MFSSLNESSTRTNYENSPNAWWKINLSSLAALVAAFLPSTEKSRNSTEPNDFSVSTGKIRILIFAESFPCFTSGITRRFKEIIRRLAEKNHRIHVITACKDAHSWLEKNQELKKKVTFSILPSKSFQDKIDCACPFLFPHPSILTSVVRFSPDIIHIVEQTPAAMFCSVVGKSLSIPIVWSSHTNIDFYLSTYVRSFAVDLARKVYRLIRSAHLQYSTVNLTVSREFADFMENNDVPRPVFVWKTGVDSNLFDPARRSFEMRCRMFGGRHRFTIEQIRSTVLFLCVGRISPEKNFEFLSQLMEKFSFGRTFLCIVGDGPYRKALEPIFPPDRVCFLGQLDGEELAAAYASADFFLYASISETFGQVYLESMASGTPIVAAEGPQLKEFFRQGQHGFVWKPNDFESAIEAVRAAIENRQSLSENARQQALRYSWDEAAEQIEQVYLHNRIHRTFKQTPMIDHFFSVGRFIYYAFRWFICILLALFLMAPFVKVSSPSRNKQNDSSTNRT